MTIKRATVVLMGIAIFAALIAMGCGGWDRPAARSPAKVRQKKTPRPGESKTEQVIVVEEELDPALEKALKVEADLTRVVAPKEAFDRLQKELAADASLVPELTPNLIAYARLSDQTDIALARSKEFESAHADDYPRLLRLVQAIVEPAAFLGLETPSESVARMSGDESIAWAKSETGRKLAKLAVEAAEKAQTMMLADGDPELFEHLFDKLHTGMLVAEAHRAAGHRRKAITAIESALESTRRERDEIRAAVEELRALKRQLAPGSGGAKENEPEGTDPEGSDPEGADEE